MTPMAIDWGLAASIAGKSFGTVFVVLVILAVVTWLIGLGFQRMKRRAEEAKPEEAKPEEAKPQETKPKG
jgi:Na+-transporting methylmalonyl-CoA/oxaloacetate decarboxylase gamma subunit